jgi:hypothetical protein
VFVEGPGEIGEACAVGGLEREVVMGEVGHGVASLARAASPRQRSHAPRED